jgi:hypothetical protein
MVTILPPKTNIGSQIGQAIAPALQQGMQMGLQRGMLQKALGKVKDIANPAPIGTDEAGKPIYPDVNPLEALTALMEAGAGIPGSERYLGALAPLLLGSLRSRQLYGTEGEGGGVSPVGKPPSAPVSPATARAEALNFVEGNKPAGYLALPMTPQQEQDYAKNYAQVMNDPQAFDQGLQQAQNINNQRMQARQSISNEADALGILPEEKQRFMQYATENQETNDPTAIVRYAYDKTLQLRNMKDALQNVDAPGIYQKLGGPLQHVVPGMTLYKALTNRGESRRKALKGYEQLVKNIVNEGEEPFARATLRQKGLSDSEIEELIHPLTDIKAKEIRRLPKGDQLSPKARQDMLVKFFRDNLDNNTSLSVLRNYLVEEKKFNWEEIRDAINSAFPQGQNLTKYQNAELANIAKPPIQSLSQIFGPQANIPGFLRGQR